MGSEMSTISMAEFEARGFDALAYILERYRAVFLRNDRGDYRVPVRYRSDGDVGVFSLERMNERPKYGLLMEVPKMLIAGSGKKGAPTDPYELPHASFELRAAYAACRVIENMLIAEAVRLEEEAGRG